MTREREEKERFSRGHSSGSGKSGSRYSDGSGNETSYQNSDNRHRSRRTTRKGLRIFVGTANLSQTIPDEESLAAFLPNKGRASCLLNSKVKSSSVVDGVSKKDFNQVDRHGMVEVPYSFLGFKSAYQAPWLLVSALLLVDY
ncbi:hypothetical protein ACHAWT_009939 [Skeletonema menzelii]